MATRLVKNLRNDYLSCPICLEQYRTPKTLPCEHSFCGECLIDHVNQTIRNGRTQCPVCRENIKVEDSYMHNIDQWVRTLPTDTLLSSLVQTLDVHERREPEYEYTGAAAVCTQHKKSREAYCFTHAQLICWECAARDHRNCSIDSATKAGHVIPSAVKALKTKLDKHLNRSKDLCKSDHKFVESKAETVTCLDRLERNLNTAFTSARKQIFLMREEVEVYDRKHLEQRSRFYDLVAFLLEMNYSLETIDQSNDVMRAISVLEKLEEGVGIADEKMADVESSIDEHSFSKLSFIMDEEVDTFLKSYASVGFIDVCRIPQTDSGNAAEPPHSIAHILNREPGQTDSGNATEPPLSIAHILNRESGQNNSQTTEADGQPVQADRQTDQSNREPDQSSNRQQESASRQPDPASRQPDQANRVTNQAKRENGQSNRQQGQSNRQTGQSNRQTGQSNRQSGQSNRQSGNANTNRQPGQAKAIPAAKVKGQK